jgi:sugar phosphate isomerase/epimerase
MEFGCCIPSEHAKLAAEFGYDFVELRTGELFPEGSTTDFMRTSRNIDASGIPALSFNFFLPPTIKIVGPEIDSERQRLYLETIAERGSSLGGQYFVLGSGRSRRIPEGYSREVAINQFHDFARMAGDIVGRHGMSIVLEHLNHSEANFMHTVKDGIEQMIAINHPQVFVLADFYHMIMENEPLFDVLLAGERLHHVHVCDAGRGLPGTRGYNIWDFFSYLNSMGYDRAISVEAAFDHFAIDGPKVFQFLHEAKDSRGEVKFSL